jgi:hypothetical protein
MTPLRYGSFQATLPRPMPPLGRGLCFERRFAPNPGFYLRNLLRLLTAPATADG